LDSGTIVTDGGPLGLIDAASGSFHEIASEPANTTYVGTTGG
jgi:hypothetical protein